MATENKEVTSVLNDLIETTKDGEQGFRNAAEKVKEASLKSLFAKYASQRAEYGQELQTLWTQLGVVIQQIRTCDSHAAPWKDQPKGGAFEE